MNYTWSNHNNSELYLKCLTVTKKWNLWSLQKSLESIVLDQCFSTFLLEWNPLEHLRLLAKHT